jgi:hypothetical protein
MGWNEVTQPGNPTKSSEIIDRIKKVKKEEVRKTGKKSLARPPLEHSEFKQSLTVLESDPDPIKRFLAPCVNKVQYNLIARLDDAMELEMEDTDNPMIAKNHPDLLQQVLAKDSATWKAVRY